MLNKNILHIFMGTIIALSLTTAADAGVIADEDFESGAAGWSDNSTTDGGSTFTTFLGRMGSTSGDQYLYKDFILSGTQSLVTISFSFYEIDSWDSEDFVIYIDNNEFRRDEYLHNREDAPAGTTDLFGGASSPDTDYGFNSWPDQGVGYSFTYFTTASSIRLGFGATIDQDIADESWGIDNILITDNTAETPIPEPATMLLLGTGLLGLATRLRKKK